MTDHPRRPPSRTVLVAVGGPLLALATTVVLGLYAVHRLRARRGADWTGLGFGEFFVWGVAVVLTGGVLVALAVLLLLPRFRTRPLSLATALSGAVALAGFAFCAAAWSVAADSSLVRPASTEAAAPLLVTGASVSLAPLVVTSVGRVRRR